MLPALFDTIQCKSLAVMILSGKVTGIANLYNFDSFCGFSFTGLGEGPGFAMIAFMVFAGGTVDIELKDSEICFGAEMTLVARVSGVDMDYRLVWEANDGDGRGWYAIGSGSEYTFILTRDNAEREYRVSLYRVD